MREDKSNRIYLKHGEPIRFGEEGERGVVREADGSVRVVAVAEVGEDALLVHDAHALEPSLAFALVAPDARRVRRGPVRRPPLRPAPGLRRAHVGAARDGAERQGEGDLEGLLHAGDTWTIA